MKKLPEQRRAPEAWSREELEYIIQACTCLAGTKHRNIPSDVYWDALLRVEYYTALRRRALFGLRKEHFDLGQGILRVPPGLMKTNSGKKFKIGSDAVRSLERLWPYVQERIFPFEENHFRRIYDQFYEILTAAGVKRSTAHANVFHQLRRSTATIVADSRGNAAAAQLLGHLGEVTIQRYIDQTKVQALDLSEVLIPLPEASGNSSPNAEQSRKSREFATTRPRVRQTLQTAGSMKDPFE